jgi:hypothetical protein
MKGFERKWSCPILRYYLSIGHEKETQNNPYSGPDSNGVYSEYKLLIDAIPLPP